MWKCKCCGGSTSKFPGVQSSWSGRGECGGVSAVEDSLACDYELLNGKVRRHRRTSRGARGRTKDGQHELLVRSASGRCLRTRHSEGSVGVRLEGKDDCGHQDEDEWEQRDTRKGAATLEERVASVCASRALS